MFSSGLVQLALSPGLFFFQLNIMKGMKEMNALLSFRCVTHTNNFGLGMRLGRHLLNAIAWQYQCFFAYLHTGYEGLTNDERLRASTFTTPKIKVLRVLQMLVPLSNGYKYSLQWMLTKCCEYRQHTREIICLHCVYNWGEPE